MKHQSQPSLRLSCRTFALISIVAFPSFAWPVESARSDRIAAFEIADSIPRLEFDRVSMDGYPRAAFQQGEFVAFKFRPQSSGELFGLIVDSHGVVSLAGANLDGWIGRVEARQSVQHEIISERHWTNGLPLGNTMVSIYVLSSAGREEMSAKLRSLNIEEGIVADATVAVLSGLLEEVGTRVRAIRAAGQTDVTFIHAKPPRGRGLGVQAPSQGSTSNLVDREMIIRHFTGPRSRGVSRIRLDLYIQFAFDSAEVAPNAMRQLDEVAAALHDQRMSGLVFRVGGHTDRVGTRPYNMGLSRSRAQSVREVLVGEHGIAASSLVASGFAYDRALNLAQSPEADATNRRVDFQLMREWPGEHVKLDYQLRN